MKHDTETGKGFLPGSHRPESFHYTTAFSEELEGYLDDGVWNDGISVTFIGPPGCGKTSLGLSLLRAQWKRDPEVPQGYWTERDFLTDLRALWRLEEMTQRAARDEGLWSEYMDWEHALWDLKDRWHLFLDDMCVAYTPMQWYEIEGLLKYREAYGYPTMLAVTSGRWDAASAEIQSVMARRNVMVTMDDRSEQ